MGVSPTNLDLYCHPILRWQGVEVGVEGRGLRVELRMWPFPNLLYIVISLYSLIRDFFMIWRLIKDFKSHVVFSAGFDYDIDAYYIYIHTQICRNFISNVPHVHNIASQTMGKVYIETFQSLRLLNIVIHMLFIC